MKVWFKEDVRLADLQDIADRVGVEVPFLRDVGNAKQFELELRSTPINPEGDKLYQRKSPTGRRIGNVCWHGYRNFLQEMFERYPNARVITGYHGHIEYDGIEDFLNSFGETGSINVGTKMEPMEYENACLCWKNGDEPLDA